MDGHWFKMKKDIKKFFIYKNREWIEALEVNWWEHIGSCKIVFYKYRTTSSGCWINISHFVRGEYYKMFGMGYCICRGKTNYIWKGKTLL